MRQIAYSVFKKLSGGGTPEPTLYAVFLGATDLRYATVDTAKYLREIVDIQLALSKIGCFIGNLFVGALAYADDIALLAPTTRTVRSMLGICDDFAQEYVRHCF